MLRLLAAVVMAALVAACSSGARLPPQSALPEPLPVYPTESSLRIMSFGLCPFFGWNGAATVLTPHWAVMTPHSSFFRALLAPESIPTPDRDLAFIPITGGKPLPPASARVGERLWLYGVGCGGDYRYATGTMRYANAGQCWGKERTGPIEGPIDRCCRHYHLGVVPAMLAEVPDAGDGFSGGVVVNEKGAVLGVIQGILTDSCGTALEHKLVLFYGIEDVLAQLRAAVGISATHQ